MTPVEIYKELPKTNCGECGQLTCMAFAIAVSKGDTEIQSCPYLNEENVKTLSKSIKKIDIKEKIYENLKDEIQKINLRDVADGIGAVITDEGITIRSLGKEFLIKDSGEIITDGEVSIWAKILLLIYIKMGGKGDISNKWVAFDELKGGVVKIEALRKEFEIPLSDMLKNDLDPIERIFKILGAEEVNDQPSDMAWKMFLLPKVPILILYWRADDEFPPNVKALFDSTTDRFLDVESLVFLCEGLLHAIGSITGKRFG